MSDCVILLFHWEMMCWNRHPAALCVLLHSLIHLYGFISPCWRRYVTRAEELLGSPVRSVCHVLSRKRFVSAGGGSQQDFTCNTASAARGGSSILTLGQGHGFHWSDHHLCLFSPAALRDRCKCSSNFDVLAETSPAALHLFIITPVALLPPPPPPSCISSPPGLASLSLPVLFSPQPFS